MIFLEKTVHSLSILKVVRDLPRRCVYVCLLAHACVCSYHVHVHICVCACAHV